MGLWKFDRGTSHRCTAAAVTSEITPAGVSWDWRFEYEVGERPATSMTWSSMELENIGLPDVTNGEEGPRP